LLSSDASTCHNVPFCPIARIRAALRIPGGARPYQGIRAAVEQPSPGEVVKIIKDSRAGLSFF